jgi:putative endonuclease
VNDELPSIPAVMPGFMPGIHVFQDRAMSGGYIYILTNRPSGTLNVEVTNDIIRRVFERRSGTVDGFTKRYGLKRLVYFEALEDIRRAIQRGIQSSTGRAPGRSGRSRLRIRIGTTCMIRSAEREERS